MPLKSRSIYRQNFNVTVFIAYDDFYYDGSTNVHRTGSTNTDVYHSYYLVTWATEEVCTTLDVYVFDASAGSDVTFDLPTLGTGSETCTAGNMCTFVLSRGYNRPCNQILLSGTIQREVVFEFQ